MRVHGGTSGDSPLPLTWRLGIGTAGCWGLKTNALRSRGGGEKGTTRKLRKSTNRTICAALLLVALLVPLAAPARGAPDAASTARLGAAATAPASLPSVALLPVPVPEGYERAALVAGLNDLVESRLSQNTRLRLVTRSDIDLVLKEIDLSATSLRDNGLLEAGRLLKADIVVLTRVDGAGKGAETLLVKMVQQRDGRILLCTRVSLATDPDIEILVEAIAAAVSEGLEASPTKQAPTIAITPLRNRSIFDRLDVLRYELRDELIERLAATPGIVPVERTDVRMLLGEDRIPTAGTAGEPASASRRARYVLLGIDEREHGRAATPGRAEPCTGRPGASDGGVGGRAAPARCRSREHGGGNRLQSCGGHVFVISGR